MNQTFRMNLKTNDENSKQPNIVLEGKGRQLWFV